MATRVVTDGRMEWDGGWGREHDITAQATRTHQQDRSMTVGEAQGECQERPTIEAADGPGHVAAPAGLSGA